MAQRSRRVSDQAIGATVKLTGRSPRWQRSHIVAYAASRCRRKRSVSNSGKRSRLPASRLRIAVCNAGASPAAVPSLVLGQRMRDHAGTPTA